MPNYDIGTGQGRIKISASDIGRAVASLDLLGNKMLLVGALAAAGFGYAVKSAADFEEQLSRFKAVTGANEKQLDSLREKALQLGRDSAYGATEVVQGFVELGKAGLTVQDVLAGVGDAAVYLAAAGEIGMTAATETLVATLRTFKLPASDAVRVANLLAGAANASLSEVSDLAVSLKYAGPIAATAGVSLEDLTATLAIFSNVGIKGSTAGTSFRSMLLGLAASTPKAANQLKALGIITKDGTNQFFDAAGALKPLGQVFDLLGESMKGLSKHEQIVALNAIFQRRAISAAAEAAIQGGKGFDAMREAQEKVTAQQVMETKLDNLKGSLKILKASLETFAITIGESFQAPLKDAADLLRDVTNWFIKLSPETKKIIGYALAGAAAFFLFGGALSKVLAWSLRSYKAFRDLGAAIRLLTTLTYQSTIAFLSSPIGWITLAVIALAVAVYFLWTRWDEVWNWIMEHKAVAVVLALLFPFIAALVAIVGAVKYVYEHWAEIWPKIKAVAKDVVNWLVQAWDDVKKAFDDAVTWIGDSVDNIIQFFEELPGKVEEGINATLDWIQHLPETLANLARAAILWLVKMGVNIITGLVTGFTSALPAITSFLLHLPIWITEFFLNALTWLVTDGLDIFLGLLDGLIQGGRAIQAWIINDFIPGLLNFFKGVLLWLFQAGWDILQGFWNGSLAVIGAVLEWFGGLAGSMVAAVGTLIGTLFEAGWEIITGLWDGAKQVFVDLWAWLFGLPGQMISAVGDLGNTLLSAGKDLIKGFWEGAKKIAERVVNWAADFASDIVHSITDPLGITSPSRVFRDLGRNTIEGYLLGLQDKEKAVLGYMANLAPAITGTISVLPSTAAAGGAAAVAAGVQGQVGPTKIVDIDNHNVFNVLDAREAAKAVMEESAWQERTMSGGSV